VRIKAISCSVFARLVYLQAARSPHIIDVELVDQGLHDNARQLRTELQRQIDAVDARTYQAIVLAFGLCNRSLEGLQARDVPIAVPRAHDCITVYLGSRDRYEAEFAATPGTYYYSDDYLERQSVSGLKGNRIAMGVGTGIENDYEALVAKYGEDNAQYLLEVMGAWHQHYQRAAYIEMGSGANGNYRSQAREDAGKYGWRFEQLVGNITLVRRLLAAEWDDDFLVVQPGQHIVATHDRQIIAGTV
jgi:hypothetical protein